MQRFCIHLFSDKLTNIAQRGTLLEPSSFTHHQLRSDKKCLISTTKTMTTLKYHGEQNKAHFLNYKTTNSLQNLPNE